MRVVVKIGGQVKELPVDEAWSSFASMGSATIMFEDESLMIMLKREGESARGIIEAPGGVEIPVYLLQQFA